MAIVRLIDADTFPDHCDSQTPTAGAPRASNVWDDWRGTWVEIGKPIKPSTRWTCDTDIVWPVLNAQMYTRPAQSPEEYAYLCRHQFEAGD